MAVGHRPQSDARRPPAYFPVIGARIGFSKSGNDVRQSGGARCRTTRNPGSPVSIAQKSDQCGFSDASGTVENPVGTAVQPRGEIGEKCSI